MIRSAICLIAAVALPAFSQVSAFEAADVRVSPKTANPLPRSGVSRGRYEVKQATMVDLIRFAYGFENDKVVGGPSWLELDRFDVAGKVPQGATPDDHKAMLRALLADRFKLAAREDTRPLPAYTLTAPRKHSMKTADGSEETGCRTAQSSGGAPLPPPSHDGGGGGAVTRVAIVSAVATSGAGGGAPAQFTLGPGMTVSYNCRNMTMASFVSNLRTMFGTNLGTAPIVDETGLDGKFNFDLRYSINLIGGPMHDMGDRIPLPVAIEKQLGLKLEERPVPTKVLVVDRANRDPGPNPPGTSEALPPLPQATEFEVATLKPLEASGGHFMTSRFQMQPGGRLVSSGMPLMFLITRAFNTTTPDQIVNIPPFAQTDRYDLIAKVPGDTAAASSSFTDMDALAPLMLKLLVDRFNLKYHMEDRPVNAYTLVAGKPKVKKADPNSRTSCKTANAPAGAPPGSRVLTCQNVTMAQFAERLQRMAPELSWPVADATGLEGTYDLAVTFTMRPQMMMGGVPMSAGMAGAMMGATTMGGGGGGGAVPTAADPIPGQTIFEAVEKQLGLKLEKRPRTGSVIVIDHMDQKPTEN